MECPFCAETIKDEARVCKHCSRDLAVVRPVMIEVQDLVAELDTLQRRIDRIDGKLALRERPVRLVLGYLFTFVVPAAFLLLVTHYLIIVQLNVSPLYLRLASLIIPLPFGIAAYVMRRIYPLTSAALGVLIGLSSVFGMLAVIGWLDDVPVIPASLREWREALEYAASIALSFVTGTILAMLLFAILPRTIAADGQPSTVAYRAASLLGQHVGKEGLRRRARRIQDLMETVGPLIGVAATAAGSIYAGLKSVLDT